MRIASMVLGIVGGGLAIFVILIFVLFGTITSNFGNDMDDISDGDFSVDIDSMDGNSINMDIGNTDIRMNESINSVFGILNTIVWAGAIISFLGAAFGIIGGAFARSKNVMAGVFMLIGAFLCLITLYGILSFILLLLGGIFALVKDNRQPHLQPQPPAS